MRLYRRGTAPTLIFTGGTGVGDTVSEAEVGGRYAVRQSVDAQNILTETGGLNSQESIRAVAELMHEHGIDRVVLVSDSFHMLRLRVLAARRASRRTAHRPGAARSPPDRARSGDTS